MIILYISGIWSRKCL